MKWPIVWPVIHKSVEIDKYAHPEKDAYTVSFTYHSLIKPPMALLNNIFDTGAAVSGQANTNHWPEAPHAVIKFSPPPPNPYAALLENPANWRAVPGFAVVKILPGQPGPHEWAPFRVGEIVDACPAGDSGVNLQALIYQPGTRVILAGSGVEYVIESAVSCLPIDPSAPYHAICHLQQIRGILKAAE